VQRGAAVCVNYAVHADAAEALIAEIAAAGGRAIAVAADVAEAAAVEAMVARTEAELGPVTILVNNAGVAWQGTLDTYDREQVARMRQVNVEGMIHATRASSCPRLTTPVTGRPTQVASSKASAVSSNPAGAISLSTRDRELSDRDGFCELLPAFCELCPPGYSRC
jgi:NADP-dependent 3-hydroxy acid dehydrogenase YdfG